MYYITHLTQSNKTMENLMKVTIFYKYNKFIESIARGSEPTVRCNPHIQRWARWSLTLRKVSYIKSILLFSFLFYFTFCNVDSQMKLPVGVPKEAKFDRKKNIFTLIKDGQELVWYDNGKLYSDCKLGVNGMRNGECRYFSQFNGNLLSIGIYADNFKDGLWHWYFPNGNIYYKQNFSKDHKRPVWVETNLLGNEHGAYERYYQDGKLEERGDYEAGFKSGKWEKYYPNGKLEYTGSYLKDNKIGQWKFYFADGKVEAEESYDSKSEFVSRLTYFPDGSLNCKNFKDKSLECR